MKALNCHTNKASEDDAIRTHDYISQLLGFTSDRFSGASSVAEGGGYMTEFLCHISKQGKREVRP